MNEYLFFTLCSINLRSHCFILFLIFFYHFNFFESKLITAKVLIGVTNIYKGCLWSMEQQDWNSAAYTSLRMKFGVYTMSILQSINGRFTTCNYKFYRVVNVLNCIGMLFFKTMMNKGQKKER